MNEKDWPVAYTADGVLITPGLWVWTNNYEQAQVTRYLHSDKWSDGRLVPWFDTTDCMCDGSRMITTLKGKKAGSVMGTQDEDFCEVSWDSERVRHHCAAYPDGTITQMEGQHRS